MKGQRLELTWIGKEQRPRLEPRILLEDPELSYHAMERVTEADLFDNRLIFGDNLLALKALEQEFAGKVKCIFIDPPYNTGSAFAQYDDGVEHSLWLSLMRDRLELLRRLLTPDGSLWITIDDNEAHYLKVLCDEIFGRRNFIANFVWEKADSPRMDAKLFSSRHDHVLAFAKDISIVALNKLDGEEVPSHYDKTDEQGRQYYLKPLRYMGQGDSRQDRPNMFFPIVAPNGDEVYPLKQDGTEGRWRWGHERVERDRHRLEFVRGRAGWSVYTRLYADDRPMKPVETVWRNDEVGTNRTSKAEAKALNLSTEAFATPKPEALMKRILEVGSNVGDLVIDSFAGSGTTGAVAQKMGRRWIMVELGEHCHTHIIPRLRKVIDGEDPGGVTEATGWKGGGGFRYYKLAPSLLKRDKYGQWVINDVYNAEMLAEAMCKHMGFTYSPSGETYWQHGQSTETDFIYVTTQTFNAEAMAHLAEEVGPNRSLLVCCTAWTGNPSSFPNLNFTKIPNAVLNKCEFGKDDYSLKVQNLPMRAPAPGPEPTPPKGRRTDTATGDLFAEAGDSNEEVQA